MSQKPSPATNATDEYRKSFSGKTADESSKAKEALNLALDIRKFEIGLYWQRAAYFWALIAAAFAGYFAILSADKLPDREYLAYIVSCIGLIFTWAWLLVNRGSKYWQENWEAHVDMLEDEVVGPLYKTVLYEPSDRNFREKYLLGPEAISVSKVNLIVSLFTLCIWIVLLVHSLRAFDRARPVSWKHVTVGAITLFFAIFMAFGARTRLGSQKRAVAKRTTEIV
jgi:hypothetical protein